jgi:hypothetical protein
MAAKSRDISVLKEIFQLLFEVSVYCIVKYINMVNSGEAGARWISAKDSWITYPPRLENNLSTCDIHAFKTITNVEASTPTEYAENSVQSSAAFHEGWDSSLQRKT